MYLSSPRGLPSTKFLQKFLAIAKKRVRRLKVLQKKVSELSLTMSLFFIRPTSNMMAFVPEETGSMKAYEQLTVTGNMIDKGLTPMAVV